MERPIFYRKKPQLTLPQDPQQNETAPQEAPLPRYAPPIYPPQQPQYQQPQQQLPSYDYASPGAGGWFDGAISVEDLSRPLYGATFGQAVKRFFKNYVKFTGRASLSEYWWATLFLTILTVVITIFMTGGLLLIIGSLISSTFGLLMLGLLLLLIGFAAFAAILVPSISLSWRRLHDADLSGLFYLLALAPYVGSIVVLIFALLPSKVNGRRFDVAGNGAL